VKITIGSFQICLKILRKSKCTTRINNTSSKFATGVNDTGGKSATSVNNTGGKLREQFKTAYTLKNELEEKIYLYVNSITQSC
jgi:hypothetical protein